MIKLNATDTQKSVINKRTWPRHQLVHVEKSCREGESILISDQELSVFHMCSCLCSFVPHSGLACSGGSHRKKGCNTSGESMHLSASKIPHVLRWHGKALPDQVEDTASDAKSASSGRRYVTFLRLMPAIKG